MALAELGKRVTVAAIAIPIVMAAVFAGAWWLGALLAAASALGALELYRLAEARGGRPFRLAGAGLAALFVLVPLRFRADHGRPLWAVVLLGAVLLASGAIWARGVDGSPLGAVSITLFGAILLGGSLSHGMFLRYLPVPGTAAGADSAWTGTVLVAFPLVLTWLSDTGAFFGGRAFGRRKLMPSVSPGKTGRRGSGLGARWWRCPPGWLRSWFGLGLQPRRLCSRRRVDQHRSPSRRSGGITSSGKPSEGPAVVPGPWRMLDASICRCSRSRGVLYGAPW
jgi:phosphatidate cytidylyltransferase